MQQPTKPPTTKGPADTFTGDVWVDPITRGLPPSQLSVAAVHFSPGARSAWHSHDGGQTLYVTEGRGLVQARGQAIVQLNTGDVVFAPDGEEHWHGAAPDHFMTHLSITEGAPHWGLHVTDDEYHARREPKGGQYGDLPITGACEERTIGATPAGGTGLEVSVLSLG